MGKEKAGFLTPKAIGNRIKAKGLQKLRWYCQMCQKQCRDENGFKCHVTSESHQRQLLLFADNPDDYIDQFSKDFLDGYLELLRRRFGTKRVLANTVYQEYITDRHHIHMNSTQWETLSIFVKWLGEQGFCVVDETEKGWFVTYIDRDPETIKRQEQLKNKEKMDKTDDELQQRFIEKQMERASEKERDLPKSEYTELKRENEDEKLAFGLGKKRKIEEKPATVPQLNPLSNPLKDRPSSDKPSSWKPKTGEKRKSALDEIMEFEETRKEKANRRHDWLHEGVVVKVITKKLGDDFYKRKGVIRSVDGFVGVVKMIDSGKKVKVDQEHLETVIPAIGKPLLIVNGAYRGHEAILDKLEESDFSCTVSIKQGPLKGRVLHGIKYEDLSKLYQPT